MRYWGVEGRPVPMGVASREGWPSGRLGSYPPRRRGHAVMALLCLLGAAPVARAQVVADNSTSKLMSMTLEQLMNVEVTSVARYPEKLLHAASAIQVITQEDIERSGATSLPEALRLADNLDVAQKNSHDWGISARGFNTALANKLLVMIDGRTVYTPLYSGVFWDQQDYLLQDIDRIEVISGPGGTLWGANAVNGVINIITKSAENTQGLYVEGGGGSELQEFGAMRFGDEIGNGVFYRVYGKYDDQGDEVVADGAPASDSWHRGQTGFRVDTQPSAQDTLSFHGDFNAGHENIETGGVADTDDSNIVGRWNRVFSDSSDMTLQSYYSYTHWTDPTPAYLINDIPLAGPGIFQDDLTTYDVDFQDRFALEQINRIVWGLGYRFTHDAVRNAPGLGFFPTVLDQNLYSLFVQDEVALRTNVTLTVGSKVEHNDFTGFEFEPNVRLLWNPTSTQALWGAISRAVRTPSEIDRDLSEPVPPAPVVLKGGADFQSETVIAYELGYRAQLNSRASASISTFYNDYGDVRSTSYTPVTVLPFYFANNVEGDTYGVEFAGDYEVLDWWTLHGGYDLLDEHLRVKPGQYDLNDALNELSDPKHQFSIRSSMNLPAHLQFDANLRWVDTLHTNSGAIVGTVPAYFELDTRLAWRLSDRVQLSIVGQNLLHPYHVEYGFPSASREEIQRSVYGKVQWSF